MILLTRDTTAAELQDVIDITLAAYGEYAEGTPPGFWERYRDNVVGALSDERPVERIVAELDGVLVGSVLLYPPGMGPRRPGMQTGWPELRLLATVPEARGQGVARALMAECLGRVHAWGAPGLQLHTMPAMRVAREMYERMGFQRDPSLDFAPSEGVTVMGYRLEMPSGTDVQSG